MLKMGIDVEIDRLPEGLFKRYVKNCHTQGFTEKAPGVIVNGLPFYFNFSYKRIGLTFSGGIDSTMVLFLLCKIIHEHKLPTVIYPISIINNWENGDFKLEARNAIIDFINHIYPDIIKFNHNSFLPDAFMYTPLSALTLSPEEKVFAETHDVKNAHNFYCLMLTSWVSRRYALEAIYDGTTVNPDHMHTKNLERPDFRDPDAMNLDTINPNQDRMEFIHGVQYSIHNPFHLIDKPWIVAQYYNFGVPDLLHLTRSCENSGHGCGQCFHCHERQWGAANMKPYLAKNMTKKQREWIGAVLQFFQ